MLPGEISALSSVFADTTYPGRFTLGVADDAQKALHRFTDVQDDLKPGVSSNAQNLVFMQNM